MKGVSAARIASAGGLAGAAYRRGLVLSEIARGLGVDPSVVVLWAKKQRPLPLYHVERLCAMLAVSHDELTAMVTLSAARRRPVYTRPPARPQPPVRQAPPEPVVLVPPTAEPAGECLEGDHCPRWRCSACGRYWLGAASEHLCARAAA